MAEVKVNEGLILLLRSIKWINMDAAERKQSLGKDWHRQCLTCEACGKVLNPGQHAERKGVPYCDAPCYKSLFGPTLYGFGSQAGAHDRSPRLKHKNKESDELESTVASLNKLNISMSAPRMEGRSPKVTQQQLNELEDKLKIHNDVHLQNFISLIEKDGHVTLEGVMRVHWGVQTRIQFKKDDSNETTPFTARLSIRRVNKSRSFHSDLYNYTDAMSEQTVVKDPFHTLKSSGIPPAISSQQLLAVKMKRGQFHTIREQKVKRRVSINGHYYRKETSDDFTPAFGSVTQVFVGSHLRTTEVIRRLLDKFKIVNEPTQFALYMVKSNGEMWPLTDSEYPLMERVNLVDPSARIFLMDKPHQVSITNDTGETTTDDRTGVTISDVWKPVETIHTVTDTKKIPQELAGFLCLPDPMLYGFIAMFNQEQQQALDKIRTKYEALRKDIMRLMSEKQLTEETYL